MSVVVIGAGLAGCEAAWQIANRGIDVELYEMKPKRFSPAHKSNLLAELVCSNSLRADRLENAAGLLKEEMRILNSLIIECADMTRVPAGGALAVDRERFSNLVTEKIKRNKNINLIHKEVKKIPEDQYTIIATGPLTSDSLAKEISKITGNKELYFFDAAAPIVTYDSIDKSKVFKASRYNKGDADYINCPMNKEQYEKFYNELVNAETVELKEFESNKIFEGCMPVEVMAQRGKDTLLYGPLKPVGLYDPETNKKYHAVVQLRQDDTEGNLYNLVGFQTHLKFNEQKRVFRMIPVLEIAEFVRFGVMHRNTFINSPLLLNNIYQFRDREKLFFAGQITGVEGYIESTASGLCAGINVSRLIKGQDPVVFPAETAIGALSNYISSERSDFQPININFGIMNELKKRVRPKKMKRLKMAERAIEVLKDIKNTI